MKRKRAIILLICACIACIFAGVLTACGGEDSFDGVKVVFELEGGRYKNSNRAPTYYYDLAPGASCKICSPDDFGEDRVTYSGYRIDSWCRTKTVDGATGKVTYSDPWDFDRDTIDSGTESLTLYAVWKESYTCLYELCYRDGEGAVQSIASYAVAEGSGFASINMNTVERDASNMASGLGCTLKKEFINGKSTVVFYDENGAPWDDGFIHPGEDEEKAHVVTNEDGSKSYAVRVFVEFVEGRFTYVSTASELNSAIAKSENIVLMCDIDFGGEKFYGFADSTTRTYGGKKDFDGNPQQLYVDGQGHAVKNFNLGYGVANANLVSDGTFSNSLIVSLFGILDNVKVSDISFTGVTIDLSAGNSRIGSIYVAPLAVMATDSVFENVTFSGTYTCTELPKGFSGNNLYVDRENPIHLGAGTTNTVTGSSVSLTDSVKE